ncbi:EcsC family protein [Pseudonocardia sediminis]|uniref:EcsC family protein n=1 Tax=Pseudonocardia sediminis TaxID=1397368 RepID=A0A4Q7UYH4_PSEST|nr:EcsC family protein [Pseudonocardia sediminis]RZT87167.1 EcsC family protein [Pseudonocardia sediminis]
MPKMPASLSTLDTTRLNELGQRLADQVLEVGINGKGPIKGATQVADEHLAAAGGDADKAIRKLIATHVRLAAVSGFVTGAGGLVTLPIAVPAALTGLYVTATRMVAGIAHLRGHDLHSEEVRSAVLVCLLGSSASTALGKAGVEIGQKSALAALQKVPGRVLIDINKRIGFRLVTKAGEKGVINLTKLVPLVGAPIGATVDGVGCKAISTYALRTFEPVGERGIVIVDAEIVPE